jgi:PAS domain-containing protein
MASEFTLLAVTDAASLELVSKLLLQSPQNLRAEILAGDKLQHLIADLRDGKHSALCITNSGDKLAEVADSLGIAKHLQQRDEDMRRIIDASADSVLICDADGTILFLNPAAKKAFKRCEIGDHFGYPVVDGETVEVDLFCDANKRRVAEMRVVAIKWNQAEACLATLRDVTERIQAEELLESKVRDRTKDLEAANAQLRHMYRIADQAVRLRSNFIANVSHEIRTPWLVS